VTKYCPQCYRSRGRIILTVVLFYNIQHAILYLRAVIIRQHRATIKYNNNNNIVYKLQWIMLRSRSHNVGLLLDTICRRTHWNFGIFLQHIAGENSVITYFERDAGYNHCLLLLHDRCPEQCGQFVNTTVTFTILFTIVITRARNLMHLKSSKYACTDVHKNVQARSKNMHSYFFVFSTRF